MATRKRPSTLRILFDRKARWQWLNDLTLNEAICYFAQRFRLDNHSRLFGYYEPESVEAYLRTANQQVAQCDFDKAFSNFRAALQGLMLLLHRAIRLQVRHALDEAQGEAGQAQ